MALSAATPILRGFLSDLDCRWCVIAGSVDDRTPEEMGIKVSLILLIKGFYLSSCVHVLYLPTYNAHFFPAEKAPKIEMHIIHGTLYFRLAFLISI